MYTYYSYLPGGPLPLVNTCSHSWLTYASCIGRSLAKASCIGRLWKPLTSDNCHRHLYINFYTWKCHIHKAISYATCTNPHIYIYAMYTKRRVYFNCKKQIANIHRNNNIKQYLLQNMTVFPNYLHKQR